MQEIGYINIKITDSDVECDSEFSTAEIIFWLEFLKSTIFKKMIEEIEE